MIKRFQWAILCLAFVAACTVAQVPVDAKLHGGKATGGGGDVFLTNVTVIEPSGSTQTNEPVTFGLPLAAGAMTSGQSLKVIDNDTSAQILCEDDNRARDLASAIRFETPTCIVPSHTGSATKTLRVYVTSSAAPSGTDITVSDITSAFTAAASYDVVATSQRKHQ